MKRGTKHLAALCLFLAGFFLGGDGISLASLSETEDGATLLQEPIRRQCKGEPIEWVEEFAPMWRQDYLRIYLTSYLFRWSDEAERIGTQDIQRHDDPTKWKKGLAAYRHYSKLGNSYLAAGHLPEALAQYDRAAAARGRRIWHKLTPEFGKLRAYIALGDLAEARDLLNKLQEKRSARRKPMLKLAEAIMAVLDQDYQNACELLEKYGPYWHLCSNMEVMAAYSLYRCGQIEDAKNVFRVPLRSQWPALKEFAILGLSDCLLAEERCRDAEKSYERLVKQQSPLGRIGLAEMRMREGKEDEAIELLEEVLKRDTEDFWKGVAYVYLISVLQNQQKWRESLDYASRARALALNNFWQARLRKLGLVALEHHMKTLAEKGDDREILVVAEQWQQVLPLLDPSTPIVIARAYERQGLNLSALSIYERFAVELEDLKHGAKLAWENHKNEIARELLRKALRQKEGREDAETTLLVASVLYRLERHDKVPKYLKGSREGVDPKLLLEIGTMEVAMGWTNRAISDFKAALAGKGLCPDDRRYLMSSIAQLYYQKGKFGEAVRYARMSSAEKSENGATSPDPMEVLSLMRLQETEEARARLDSLRGQGAHGKIAIRELLDTQEMISTLQEHGYAF